MRNQLKFRRFQIMKERSHQPRQHYDHYQEAHLANAVRQRDLTEIHTLELRSAYRKNSEMLTEILAKLVAAQPTLAAQCSTEAKDAARYRWLRARHIDAGSLEVSDANVYPPHAKVYVRIGGQGDALDASIDAILAKRAEKESGQ